MVRYHRYSRIFCNGSVILSQQEKCWNSNIRDFSLNGLVVRKPSEWENEDNCDFLATLKLMGSDKDFVLELDLVEESPNSLSFHINISIWKMRRILNSYLRKTWATTFC